MQGLFFFIFWTVLLYDNFRFTEVLYAFMIEEGFNRSSSHIELVLDVINKYMNENYSGIIKYIKLCISGLIMFIVDYLLLRLLRFFNFYYSLVILCFVFFVFCLVFFKIAKCLIDTQHGVGTQRRPNDLTDPCLATL